MRQIIFVIMFLVASTSNVFAHGGGTDRCGGHHNRKQGGYHVHNYAKYCACNPDSSECTEYRKGSTGKPKETDEKVKTKSDTESIK